MHQALARGDVRRGAAASLLALVAVLGGCRPPSPQADTLLLPLFAPLIEEVGPAQVTIESDGRQRRVSLELVDAIATGGSQRRAIVTSDKVRWAAEVSAGRDAVLELTAAALAGSGAETARATVELEFDGASERSLEVELRPGDGWQRHRIPLARPGAGRVVLASSQPVAWAEIHLLGPAPVERPDVVLVIIDTLRADHLSTYGYSRATSPGLDRLAESSYVFERSYSASTWTLPSTASLLTGLLPAQHGLRSVDDVLAPSVWTAAELLQIAGYHTAALTDGGFAGYRWGFGQGFERFDVTRGQAWEPKDAAVISEKAREWLADNRFHPFFLVVHSYETHQPYHNPEGFADPFLAPEDRERIKVRTVGRNRSADQVTEVEKERMVALYDGEIRRADHYLGELLASLTSPELDERTAILVTSDHGEEFLDHGGLEHGHGKVFDANVRVPMIFKPPAALGGRRLDVAVSGLDVTPTLLDLAGLPPRPELPGRSLLSLAADSPRSEITTRERAVVIEGLNSFPELNEDRYRLDLGPETVILDRVRGEAAWYDRDEDRELRSPRPLDAERWPAAAERLQALLAWQSRGALVARLPPGLDRVAVPGTSRIAPLGVWSGLEWLPAATDHADFELRPGPPGHLVFSLREGGRDWLLDARRAATGAREMLRLSTRRPDGSPLLWRPIEDEMPPPLLVFPSVSLHRPEAAELAPEDVEELRALGYLE